MLRPYGLPLLPRSVAREEDEDDAESDGDGLSVMVQNRGKRRVASRAVTVALLRMASHASKRIRPR